VLPDGYEVDSPSLNDIKVNGYLNRSVLFFFFFNLM
jgi:hypothetical protein